MPQIGPMSKQNGNPDLRFSENVILTIKKKRDRRFNANAQVGRQRVTPIEAYRQLQTTRSKNKNEAYA